MILVDTSAWVEVLKDKTGLIVERFKTVVGSHDIVFCRFIQLELLQGAKNEHEWKKLDEYWGLNTTLKRRKAPGEKQN